ncbi:MAG: Ig-like domain repeat protein [Planctomycetia bacterium]
MIVVSLAIAGSGGGSGVGALLAYNYVGQSNSVADPNLISKLDAAGPEGVQTVNVAGSDTATASNVKAFIDRSTVTAAGKLSVLAGFDDPTKQGSESPTLGETTTIPTSSVTVTGDTIALSSAHGWQTGNRIVYRSGSGTAIGGLTDGTSYFVIVVNATTVKLATTLENAVANRAIPLSSTGSGSSHSFGLLDLSRQTAFDAATTTVDVDGSNRLVFPKEHGIADGEQVVYTANGGRVIAGLESGKRYFVKLVDAKTIQLATSSGGTAINLAATGLDQFGTDSSGESFTPVTGIWTTFTSSTAVTTTRSRADQLTYATPHGLSDGAAVFYRANGAPIAGLIDGETYYAIVIDATHIQLAATLSDATDLTLTHDPATTDDDEFVAKKPIMLTSTGNSAQGLQERVSSFDLAGTTLDLPAAAGSQIVGGQIISVTLAGAGGKGTSGAGAISLNFVRMNVDAHVSNTGSRQVSAAGHVTVAASDVSRVYSGTGSLGVSTGGSAVNASIGVNDIRNTVTAGIDAANVASTAGNVTVAASEDARDINVVLGGAVSSQGSAIGGSFAVNTIKNTVDAHIKALPVGFFTLPSAVTANGSVAVLAKDTASIATLAGNVSLSFKGSAGVGMALATNNIQDTVTATIDSSKVKATTGGITVDATFAKPTALPAGLDTQIAALAVAGAGGGKFAGAGSAALNWIRNRVEAKVANITNLDTTPGADEISAAGALSVKASDVSTINTLAGAVAIAGIGSSGAAGAVGASVAYNFLGGDPANPGSSTSNVVRAAIENVSGTVRAGTIDVFASSKSQINAITVAGAAASGQGTSLALGGSVSINQIRNSTTAVISNAAGVTATSASATAVQVRVDDTSTIKTAAGGIGIAVPKGSGVGVAAGVAVAVNTVTTVTTASIVNTKLTSTGGIVLTAASSPTIQALSIGVAVAAGSGSGAKFGAAGAGSANTIDSTTEAFFKDSLTREITAGSAGISLTATDTSKITAAAGAMALAGSFGGSGVAGSVGVSVTDNAIVPRVHAFIENAKVSTAGGLLLKSKADAEIAAYTIGGSVAAQAGGSGAALAVAVTIASNTITPDVASWIIGSATGAIAPGSITLEATQSSEIEAYCISAAVSISAGSAGAALSGGGAKATNTIGGRTDASVQSSMLSTGTLALSATNTASIDATVAAVAASVAVGSSGVSAAIGASLATNSVTGTTQAYLSNSTVAATGALTAAATATQTINASVLAGSAAVTAAGSGGASLGGAGASSINTVGMAVKAFIDGDGIGGVRAASISLTALDTSSIEVSTAAASLAAAVGGSGAVAISVGVGLARNTISNDVQAFIANADTGVTTTSSTSGDITLSATEKGSIRSQATAASMAASFGGSGGIGVAGAGADATNVVLTKANAHVDASKLTSARNVTLSSLTTGVTLFTLPGTLTAAELTTHARLDKKQALAASNDLHAVSVERAAAIAAVDTKLRAAFTGANALAAGDIQVVALDATTQDDVAWNITAATAWQVIDAAHKVYNLSTVNGSIEVSKPVISAQVVSAAVGVGGGGAAGVGASVGASLVRNLIGLGLDQGATISGVSSNALTFTAPHGRQTGDAVLYQNGTGTLINGLVANSTYYCIRVDASTMRLARSAADALAGTAITLSLPAAASVAANTIGFAVEHGFAAGQPVVYRNTDPTKAAIPGLVSGQTYYVIEGTGKAMRLSSAPLDGNGDGVVTTAEKNASLVPITLGTPSALANHVFIPAGGLKLIPRLAAEVRSYVSDSSITAAGALTQTAVDAATIDASAFAGSAAASVGGAAGVSLGGAGASITNRIFTRVEAAVDGDGATGITAASVSLKATDASTITSSAGAAAVAAALGGAVGVSVAVGVGLAENTIANLIDARIVNADQGVKATTGGISIAADSRSTIATTAWAAAVSLAGGAAVGVSGAGAGIGVENRVTNTVLAHADASKLDIVSTTQSLSILATEASSLSAVGVAAAFSAAAGIGAGVAIGVGGGTARNVIANTVTASTSAAFVNNALAPATTGSGSITIRATANETAKLQLVGAAGSVAVGMAAVAGAAAVAIAENTLANNVSATVTGGAIRTPGAITIDAQSTGILTANAFAAAASVAAGIGAALAAGGATATNTVTNTVLADTLGTPTIVAGGNVTISAANTATFNASVTAVAVAGGLIGGSIGVSTIANSDSSAVTARVSTGTVTSTSGGVSIAATATDTTGTMLGVATAVTAAIGGAGAGAASTTTFAPTVTTGVAAGATVSAVAGAVTVGSRLTSDARATTYGAAGGLVAIGTSTSKATANGIITAAVDGTVNGKSIAVTADATTSATVRGTGLAGGMVSGAGAESTAISSPSVTARVGATGILRGNLTGTTTTAADSVQIAATSNPSANATAIGVAVGALAGIGVSLASATAAPTVRATVDGGSGTPVSAANLTIAATLAPASSGTTASANAIAGGGGTYGAGGADSAATGGGSVTAAIGNSVRLADGNVTVAAVGTTRQLADATAIAVGFVGVGSANSLARGQVTTLAQVGSGITTAANRTGDLAVTAAGDTKNTSKSTGGSGGAIAGNASVATTRDTSTAAATILGGSIVAGTIQVTSDQLTDYLLGASSTNVALAGASGAFGSNTSSTSATTTIGTLTALTASDSGEAVRIASSNRFRQIQTDYSAQGGAGGAISGSASLTTSTITGTSAVTVGDSAAITATNSLGSMTIVASHDLNTTDKVMMESGGLLNGAGVNSRLTAGLTNTVTLGTGNRLTSAGDIHVGSWTSANASTTSLVNTWGLASVGAAYAYVTIVSGQTVTIGNSSTILATGNVDLTAGRDKSTNNQTSIQGSSLATGYIRGLIAIPVADGASNLTSNTALDIRPGVSIRTGGNVEIASNPGSATPSSSAIGHGFQLGLIPTDSADGGSVTATTSGLVTQSGTIEAGIYRDLTILIPLGSTNATVTSGADFRPFVKSVNSTFNPTTYVNANYTADTASIMRMGVSSSNVPAVQLSGLNVRGGAVTIDATRFAGSGSITAKGGATITVENKSANYLIVGNITIPNVPGGKVFFTGTGSETSATQAGIRIVKDRESVAPSINITNSFNGPSGTSSFGPGMFVDNSIENLGGSVSLKNVQGSIGQLSTIWAAAIDLVAPAGFYVVDVKAPDTTYFAGATPIADWNSYIVYPGGNPAWNPTPDARWGAAYAVNAQYDPREIYGNGGLDWNLIYGGLSSYTSIVTYGSNLPWVGGKEDFNGIDESPSAQDGWTQRQIGFIARVFPSVPDGSFVTLRNTKSFAQNGNIGTAPSQIDAGQVVIKAQYINVNSTIKSGRTVSMDVTTNQTDLDGLRSLFTSLLNNGITLPAETVDARGAATNADVRPVINAIRQRIGYGGVGDQLVAQVCTYQFLGYFNGTSTAHIPLESVEGMRGAAGLYANAVAYGTYGPFPFRAGRFEPISPALSKSSFGSGFYSAQYTAGGQFYRTYYSGLSSSAPKFDDALAKVTFDLPTAQINVSDINATPGGGFVMLKGGIINTSTVGSIASAGGSGQVRFNNATSYPVVMNGIRAAASGSSTNPSCVVDIIDTFKPAATGQTVYVYRPAVGVTRYQGAASATFTDVMATAGTLVTSGSTTSYAPLTGTRWEWTLSAGVSRTLVFATASPWSWSTDYGATQNNPWVYQQANGSYATTTYGKVVTGSSLTADFDQQITGWSSIGLNQGVYYKSLGYAADWPGRSWTYSYVTQGRLYMRMSVKADNPFNVSFNVLPGVVDVSSTGPLTIQGKIVNPQGTTTIRAGGSLLTTSSTSLESGDVSIQAPGSSVGTVGVPLNLSLVAGASFSATASSAGVFVTSPGNVTLGQVVAATGSTAGDVSIQATGNIVALANQTNIQGRKIILESLYGTIGTAATAIRIQTAATGGSVKATASGDIRLTQLSGDLQIDSIDSAAGNVTVNVPQGKVLNVRNQTTAQTLSQEQIERVWADLRLTADTGASSRQIAAVTGFQNQVAAQYRRTWQLLGNGSVSGGSYTLAEASVSLYRAQAAAALGKAATATTDAAVQTYARDAYLELLTFFDRVYTPAYWQLVVDGRAADAEAALASPSRSWLALAPFTAYQGAFSYTATLLQTAALTMNSSWTRNELNSALKLSALSGATVVGTNVQPNISGRDVTINDSSVTITSASGVGKLSAPVLIDIPALQAGSINNDQKAALLTANAPGDIVVFGARQTPTGVRTPTATAASGSTSLTVASATGLVVGMAVTGTGIAPLTTIQAISGTTVTLSTPTTAAMTARTLTFSNTFVTIRFDGMTPLIPAGVTLSHLSLRQTTPLFTDAVGAVSIRTLGSIYLQSVAADLSVGQISSTAGEVDLTAPHSILAASGSSLVASASNLSLLAGSGSIGTSSALLPIQVAGTLLSAAAAEDVNLAAFGNLVYGQINAGGNARVGTTGSLVVAGDTTGTISGTALTLSAAGAIGQPTSPVNVALATGGTFSATAGGDLNISGSTDSGPFTAAAISSTTGSVNLATLTDAKLGVLTALGGKVAVTSAGGIWRGLDQTNILARDSDLQAQGGMIAAVASNGAYVGALRQRVSGATRASATGTIALQQDSGDMLVAAISSPGDVRLTAPSGSILNSPGTPSSVIASGNLFLLAAAGSIGLREQDLVVDIAAGSALSATAGTGIQLTESSGNLTVSTATTFGGVRLTVPAGSLSLPAGATLATFGPVLLQVRGDVALAPTSTATAGNWFAIVGNYGKTGAGPDSLVSTTKSDGTSVIAAPYTSIGRFAPTGQGAATAADPGYSDAGKTTLATIGKAAGALAGPIASDGRGNVFFFDPATNALKELDWTGSVRTLVSSGLNGALGLAVDRSGNVLIADRNTLPVVVADSSFESPAVKTATGVASFQVAPTGSPWTFTAQTGTNGSGLTGNATSLTSKNPNAPAGSQVAFLQGTGRISQSLTLEAGSYTLSLSAAQRLVSAANTQSIGVFIDGVSVGTIVPTSQNYATLTTPAFTVPKGTHTVELRGLATTDQTAFIDSVAITSAQSPAIKQWNAITGALSTIVTTSTDPAGVAVDSSGNVFFSDGAAVKRWAAATGAVSTLFTGTAPKGLATDATGNLYAVDAVAGTVRKWTASTAVVTTISAFTGLSAAQGIAVDGGGDIYVADTGNNRIQKWDGATSSVTTLVSTGLSSPTGLALDTQGNLFTINSGASSSTLDAFQPWADVPTALIGQLSAAGTDTLPAVIPASQPLYGAFVPTSNQPWLRVTSTTDGAVRYAFDAAPSAQARTGQLTILGRQVTVSQAAGLSASTITASPTISYGQSGAVTVTVTSTYAEPTGSVDLVVDGTTTFSGALVAGSATTANGVTTYSATATIAVPGLAAGDHALVANYASQATFAGSTALGSIRVDKATSAATIASSKASSTYGEAVTFTATVPAVGGGTNPTGTILIQDGGTTIATGTLTGGWFTFTSPALLGGSHSLTAVYAGDSNHLAATSTALTQTVAKKTAVPALARSAGVTPSTYGSNVTFVATLTPAVVGVPVTGTVQFYDGATPIGAPQTLSNSTASLTIPSLAGGSHTITALYAGDGVSYESATSTGIAHAVTKVTSTPLVSDAPNPSTYGATVTFTATLPAVGGGARPTGTVQFYIGTTVLVAFGTPQTLVNGTASVTSATLPVGNSSITAAYLGDDPNYLAKTSAAVLQTVNKGSSTPSVLGTPNPTTFGASVSLTATILAAGAGSMPTGTIQFLDNGVALGGLVALVNGTATLATTALTTGSHSITARYSGDANYLVTTSATFTQTVNQITTTATLATSAASTVHGGSVTFTATLPAAATGTVTFYDDTVAGNRVALSGAVNLTVAAGATTGTATFTTTALAAGVRSIVAVYSGNTNYAPSTSAAVTQTIAKATPATTVATPTAAIYGSAATLTATVARVTGGVIPTGSVTFKYGTTTLGTASLDANGTATFSTTTLAVGSYTPITATYSGDTNYLTFTSATSPAITLTVNKATPVPTIALTAGSSSSTYGSSITLTATVPAVGSGAAPTGTVQFYDGATLIGTAQTLANGTASISTSALSVSSHTAIKATYLPGADPNYLTASSAMLAAVTVAKGTLVPALTSSTVSGTVTFTITMTPATGCAFPKGTITLRDLSSAAASFGTATLNATTGVATFSIAATTFSAIGAHPITATYTPAVAVGLTAGEPNYLTATSAQLLQATVAPTGTAASTVSVTSSTAASVAFGTSVTFTATITVASGVAAPTGGVVEFWDGTIYLGKGTITLVGGAYKATFAIATLARGSHAIKARFIGSASHAVSNSSTLTQTIT